MLAGINVFGYIAPESTSQILIQSDSVRTFFSWCFAGLPMIGYGICAVIMLFYDIESQMPDITLDLAGREVNN